VEEPNQRAVALKLLCPVPAFEGRHSLHYRSAQHQRGKQAPDGVVPDARRYQHAATLPRPLQPRHGLLDYPARIRQSGRVTPGPSDQDATSRPGLGSFPGSIRVGAKIGSAAPANRRIVIYSSLFVAGALAVIRDDSAPQSVSLKSKL
jgi:hypothetical protein